MNLNDLQLKSSGYTPLADDTLLEYDNSFMQYQKYLENKVFNKNNGMSNVVGNMQESLQSHLLVEECEKYL